MKKSKGLSLKTTTALVVIMVILGIGSTMWYYALYKVVHMEIYDMELKVVETKTVGFNADASLHFGKLPMWGGITKKNLIVNNDWGMPVNVNVRVKGDIAPFISVSENNFVLQPGEHRSIDFFARVPDGYNKVVVLTGEAKLIITRE